MRLQALFLVGTAVSLAVQVQAGGNPQRSSIPKADCLTGGYCNIEDNDEKDQTDEMLAKVHLDARLFSQTSPRGFIFAAYKQEVADGMNYLVLRFRNVNNGPRRPITKYWCVVRVFKGWPVKGKEPQLLLTGEECSSFPDAYNIATHRISRIVLDREGGRARG